MSKKMEIQANMTIEWLPDLYKSEQMTNDAGENERACVPQRQVTVYETGETFWQIGIFIKR